MSLEVVVGPMFSGKSSYIVETVRRYQSVGMNVLVVKPTIDLRYTTLSEISTHDGIRFDCISLSKLIPGHFDDVDVLIIEEAQFFEDLVLFVKHAVETEMKTVVVVGLDGDYNRKPFGQILDCIPLADKITKLTALCSECRDGTPALFSYRKTGGSAQIQVGGASMYEAYCRTHYLDATTAE